MASRNLARLGVVLGIDVAEWEKDINAAISANKKLSREIKADSNAAERELARLKFATEDYGKTLTQVELIQREISSGRYQSATQKHKDELLKQAAAYDAIANSAKKAGFTMTEQQKIGLAYQTTDLVTQIASGGNPLIALMQQGGQLKDQMGGFGNMLKAIGTMFTPFKVAVLGGAAALGYFSFAAYKGAEEMAKLRDALILTNNIAGLTNGTFLDLARTLSDKTNLSVGNTKDILMAVAASGQFADKSIKSVTEVIATYAKISGLSGQEAANKLIPSLNGSASSAAQLNSQFNFLTLAQYRQISQLALLGKNQEAAALTAELLNKSLSGQTRELGTLEKILEESKKKWSEWWDAAMNIGRPETVEDKIKKIQDRLKDPRSYTYAGRVAAGGDKYTKEADEAALRELLKQQAMQQTAVLENSRKTAEEKARIEKYIAAGGMEKERALRQENDQLRFTNYISSLKEFAADSEKIELDALQKMGLAKLEMEKKNQQENYVFAVQNAKILAEKVIEIEREKNTKIRELQLKSYIENSEQLRSITEDSQAAANEIADAQQKVIIALREAAATSQIAYKADQDKLSLKMRMMGATQKEIELAELQIEKARDLALLERESLSPEVRALKEKAIEALYAQKEILAELNEQMRHAGQIHEAIFGNMEKALENFVKTGKLSFKEFAQSVIQDLFLIEMKLQATRLVKGMLGGGGGLGSIFGLGGGIGIGDLFAPGGGSGFGAVAASGFMAEGGPVSSNTPYIVGEQGPELFVPGSAGTIIPNNQLATMGSGQTVNYNGPYIANMQAIDTQSATQFLAKNKMAVWSANQSASRSVPQSR